VTDDKGATATQAVVMSIAGTNDAPVITSAMLSGSVTEQVTPAGNLTSSGTVNFSDVDLSDSHTVSAVAASSGALGTLTASVSRDDSHTTGLGGVVTWAYSVADSAVEYLAAGQTKVETFTVSLNDGHGSVVPSTVSVTITGTNDAASISGNSTGAVTEDTTLTTSGTLAVADVDQGQAVFQAQTNVAGHYGSFVIGANGNWTYALNNGAAHVQALNTSDHVSDSFTVLSLDGTASQLVTVNVNGLDDNHPPVAVDDLVEGSVTQVVSALTFEEGTYSLGYGQYNYNNGGYDNTVTTGDFVFTGDSSANNGYVSGPYVTGFWGVDTTNALYSNGRGIDYNNGGSSTTMPIAMTRSDGSTFSLASANITGFNDNYFYGGGGYGYEYETVTGYSRGVQVAQESFNVLDAIYQTHNNLVTFSAPGFSSVDKVVFSLTNSGGGNSHYYYAYQIIDNVGVNATAVAAQTEHRTADINVLGNDTDADVGDTLSVASFAALSAQGAAVTLNTDGTLHYDPTHAAVLQALAAGETLTDTFTYTAQDQTGAHSNTATVSVVLHGANDAASISGVSTGSVTEDVTLQASGQLLVSDVDHGEAHVQAQTNVAGNYGSFDIGADGNWTYALNNGAANVQALAAGEQASDSFTVMSQDGTASQAVNVAITGTNDAPVAVNDTLPGLVAFYKFNDASNLGLDSSGNGNNLITVGSNVSYTPSGEYGGGLALGGGGYLSTVNGSVPAGVPLGGQSYTISSWFQESGPEGALGIIGWGNYGTQNQVNALRLGTGGESIWNYWWNHDVGTYASNVYDHLFHNLAVTYDGSTRSMYLDGTLVASDHAVGLNVQNANFAVGKTVGSEYFSGVLDNVAVFNTALTAAQVQSQLLDNSDLTKEDTSVSIAGATLLANDTDVDTGDTKVLVSVQGASHGTVSLSGETVTFTPELNYNGAASFNYTIQDLAGAQSTATASFMIRPVNDAPIVATTDVNGAVTELTTTPGTATLTDSGTIAFTDVDLTDIHSVSAVTPVAGALGTLTASVSTDSTGSGTGGVVTWNYSVADSAVEYLAAGQTKLETFSFNVLDGQGGSVARTVSVTITGTNDAPVIDTATSSFAGAVTEQVAVSNSSTTTSLAFSSHTDYATGSYPRSVTSADVNGDGKADLMVANSGNSTVSVLLGMGDGTFTAKADYATGSNPFSVTSADVNGDGKADLIAANNNGNSVSVLLGVGDGTFTAKADYATGNSPRSVTSADVNGDGKADLIIANYYGASVSVLLGKGDGTFIAKADYATGYLPISVTSADVNGDGKADLISANYNGQSVSVLLGKGDGTFTAKADYATGISPFSVTSADVNGDGKADLIAANYGTNTVSVLLGKGDGTFAAKADYATGYLPVSVTSADVNGDGKADLIAANNNGNSVSVLLGVGDGTFTAKADYATGSYTRSVTSADVNGDGKADLIAANYGGASVAVLINTGLLIQPVTAPLTSTGAISFSDVDLSDVHTVSAVASVGANLGTLTASVSADNSHTTGLGGQVTWNYSVADSAVEYLAAGQTKVETFSFDVLDGQGASVTRTVDVTITGTNDAANISGTNTGSVTEDATLTASGALTVTDVDSGEASFRAQTNAAGTYGSFSMGTNGNWTYALNNNAANVQALNTSDHVSDHFTVLSQDGTSKEVTISVNGANELVSTLIDFEDLFSGGGTSIPDGYKGFNWDVPGGLNLYAFDENSGPGTGYQYGSINPGTNVAFNPGGYSPIDIHRSNGADFTFEKVYATGAYQANQVTFEGFNNGVLVGSTGQLAISNTAPQLVEVHWAPIDDLRITVVGSQIVLDNFSMA
jgi:VCBS repeat-containing protein